MHTPGKILASFITIVLLAGCAIVPITGRRQLAFVPHSQLIALGRDNFKRIIADSEISQDAQKSQMVTEVGRKIALSAERFMRENGMEDAIRGYNWEFKLIENDEIVNAFYMPGGKVAVYTGMLEIARDEEGLASVLAHEIGHAIANHGGERMSHILLFQLGGITLARALEEEPTRARRLWMQAYGLGARYGVLLPYSRTHELEADHIGLILMAQAGYDPRAAIPFLQRMRRHEKARPPEFLSTHPAPERRIEDIRSELPEAMKYYRE